MPRSYLGKRRGSKVAHTDSSDRLKISIEEAETISVESSFQGVIECKAKVDAQSDVRVFRLQNF